MKRTCGGCRAISGEFCSLGFKTKKVSMLYGDLKPLEQCPKPKTYPEYVELAHKRYKELNELQNSRGE